MISALSAHLTLSLNWGTYSEPLKNLKDKVQQFAIPMLGCIVLHQFGCTFCTTGIIGLSAVSLALTIYCIAVNWLNSCTPSWKPYIDKLALGYCFNLCGPYYLIHEGGHALMALALFRKANPKIQFHPFGPGQTNYAISYGLTSLGKMLGRQTALLAVAAAGILFTTLTALVEFAISRDLQEHFPRVAECLNLHAQVQILHDLLYCFSTFTTDANDLSHDLMTLWQDGGIHPLAPVALMIGLPVIQKLFKRRFGS